jgi:two-component sensor histidine kinase
MKSLWQDLRACFRARHELLEARDELRWETSIGAALSVLYRPLISADSTIREMADSVLEQARLLTSSEFGFVAALDETGSNRIHAVTRMPAGGRTFKLARDNDGGQAGLRGHCLNTGKPFFTNSPRSHPSFNGYPDWHPDIERFLSVPVLLEGRTAGQIALANADRDYSERDLRALKRLAGFFALALQRKEAQDQMQAALREKEILLREIHHRVKNNLQVISSLLNLQAGGMSDEKALEMLKESQNRVRSMALVHEQLHRSRELSGISFPEYVRNLTASLFSSYGIDSHEIALDLHVEEACLPIDIAVPCGLIVQELVSNALKYAFPQGRQGEITISMERLASSGRWVLRVADNGIGLPPGVDLNTASSLGLRLVRILAEQLNGSVSWTPRPGSEFRISFEGEDTGNHKRQ